MRPIRQLLRMKSNPLISLAISGLEAQDSLLIKFLTFAGTCFSANLPLQMALASTGSVGVTHEAMTRDSSYSPRTISATKRCCGLSNERDLRRSNRESNPR